MYNCTTLFLIYRSLFDFPHFTKPLVACVTHCEVISSSCFDHFPDSISDSSDDQLRQVPIKTCGLKDSVNVCTDKNVFIHASLYLRYQFPFEKNVHVKVCEMSIWYIFKNRMTLLCWRRDLYDV